MNSLEADQNTDVDQSPAPVPLPAAPAPNQRSKPVVLIADDQSAVQSLLCMGLRKTYEIIEAADGFEALTKAIEHRPDLIVADVVMPRMSGVELVERIRRHPDLANTAVIVMSGFQEPGARERLEQLGISAFVRKPFTVADMCTVIADVLKASRTSTTQNNSPIS